MLKKLVLAVALVILPMSGMAYDLTKLDETDFLQKTRNDIGKYTVEVVIPENSSPKRTSVFGQGYRSSRQISNASRNAEVLKEELIQAISQSNCCLVLVENKHEPDMWLMATIGIEAGVDQKSFSGDNIFSRLAEGISRQKKSYTGYRIARGIRSIRQEKTTAVITVTVTLKLVDSGSGAMIKGSTGKNTASTTIQSRNSWLGKSSSSATDSDLRPTIVAAIQDALNNF